MAGIWHRIRGICRLDTLKKQITITCIGLLSLSLVFIMLINHTFLESYYVSRKMEVLLDAKEAIAELDMEELFDEQSQTSSQEGLSVALGFQRGGSRKNFTWAVCDPETAATYTSPLGDVILSSKIVGYAFKFDLDNSQGKVIASYDDCVIQIVYDRFAELDYLECWGQLASGYYFLIRSPLESIRESAHISNTFYVWVGTVIVVLGGIAIYICTKRITRPISELTVLSEKMTNLEFDVRYSSHAGNEIDKLGENFNNLSSELEKTISELKSANIELQADIEDKIKIDEMRKEFLDNVSHELKTPIALIQGYAEGLKDGIGADPESMAFYIDVILDEAVKMNKLVGSLLTLNQLESGRDQMVMERFDITELIRNVIANMEILVGQSPAKIQFEAKEPIYVWADEFKTEEVLTNYVSNALHHVSGDNVIDIQVHKEGEKAKITVFNSGSPIPEEALPNLWVKFYKVDKARTRAYGGSGIGLSIVKAIMEAMHQDYGVQNYDNGVEFYFTLDLK